MAVTGTSKWVCPSCTYHNWLTATKCTLCHFSKPLENVVRKTPSPKLRAHTQSRTAMAIAWPKAAMSPEGASVHHPRIISPEYHPSGSPPPISHPPSEDIDLCNYQEQLSSSRGSITSQTPSGKWVCQSCTYTNWPNVNQCVMCCTVRGTRPYHVRGTGRQRSSEASSSGILPTDSILDYASYVGAVGGTAHTSSAENLSIRSRDSPVHSMRAKGGRNGNRTASNMENRAMKKWKCQQCTYENWPRASRCVLCHNPKKRTPSPPLSRPQTAELPSWSPTNPSQSSSSSSSASPSSSLTLYRDNDRPSPTHPRSGSSNSNEAGATLLSDAPPSPSSTTVATNGSSTRVLISYASDASPSPEILASVRLKSGSDEVRQIRNRLSTSDWLFLNACLGVVNDDTGAVKAYLRQGGDRARQLTKDDCTVLGGEASKFSVGSTLVHLAIRYRCTCTCTCMCTCTYSIYPRPPCNQVHVHACAGVLL